MQSTEAASRRTALLGAAGAALTATIVGVGGTVALIVEAGHVLGAAEAQITSWVTALCIGIAITSLGLSLAFRMPIVAAWSTPGLALIISSAAGTSFPVAVAAFLLAGLIAVIVGLFRPLERIVARIPQPIAAAMLAGVLLPFCLGVFTSAARDAGAFACLLGVYVVARVFVPLASLLLVLAAGIVLMAVRGDLPGLAWQTPLLVFTAPDFQIGQVAGLAVPLFVVTMTGQNLPGLAVLQASGYRPPTRPVIMAMGTATLALAPFGVHGINLAAITAGLCTSPDAHPDPRRRYIVGVFYAAAYAATALLAAPLVAFFAAVPRPVLSIVAGLALLGPLGFSLSHAFSASEETKEAVVVTMLATASGVTLVGLAAPFWGLLLGLAVLVLRKAWSRRRRTA